MLKWFAFFLCLTVVLQTGSGLAADPSVLRQEANQQVKVGLQLTHEAQTLLQGETNFGKVRAALNLFIEAGKLFEQASARYQALIPEYASEQDLNNAKDAMQLCLERAQNLRAYLAR